MIVSEGGKLRVGGSLGAWGVMVQFRLTVPVNPPDGFTVMVDVLPLVAPRTTVMAVPLIVKLGDGLAVSPIACEVLEP